MLYRAWPSFTCNLTIVLNFYKLTTSLIIVSRLFHNIGPMYDNIVWILFDRGFSYNVIKTLINWYSKINAFVRWNGTLSNVLCIKSGVIQGGILSPTLFSLYVDVIISSQSVHSMILRMDAVSDRFPLGALFMQTILYY